MNESKIQNFLFAWLENKKQRLITPNVKLYEGFESDLISVSRANMISEYEIKISVGDFNRDFKKTNKHIFLAGAGTFKAMTPNYFNFVLPLDLYAGAKEQFINSPGYAGLIVVDHFGKITILRKAKKLHNLPASDRDLQYLGRGLMFRYWKARGYAKKSKR